MLWGASAINGNAIEASDGWLGTVSDGKIGHVEGFLADDAGWNIRCIKADTMNWWPGERVLISPYSLREIDWLCRLVHVNGSRQKIKTALCSEPLSAWANRSASKRII